MDIQRVACVGAGLIGQGWATIFSSRGLEVIVQGKSLNEIRAWRDEMLVKLLELMGYPRMV